MSAGELSVAFLVGVRLEATRTSGAYLHTPEDWTEVLAAPNLKMD